MGHHLHRARLIALAKEQEKLIASGVDPADAKAQCRAALAKGAPGAASAPKAKRKAKAKAKRRRRA